MSDATIFKDIARHAKSLDQLKDESGSYRKDMEMALNDLKTKMKEKRDMLDAVEKMEDEEEKELNRVLEKTEDDELTKAIKQQIQKKRDEIEKEEKELKDMEKQKKHIEQRLEAHLETKLKKMNEGKKHNVMFLCNHNSCRSQMAEGWLRYLRKDTSVGVASAGIQCGTKIREGAKIVMKEAGVDISNQKSESMKNFDPNDFDVVISMCGCGAKLDGADVNAWKQRDVWEDWNLDDPPKLDTGDLNVYRRVRDECKAKVQALLDSFSEKEEKTEEKKSELLEKKEASKKAVKMFKPSAILIVKSEQDKKNVRGAGVVTTVNEENQTYEIDLKWPVTDEDETKEEKNLIVVPHDRVVAVRNPPNPRFPQRNVPFRCSMVLANDERTKGKAMFKAKTLNITNEKRLSECIRYWHNAYYFCTVHLDMKTSRPVSTLSVSHQIQLLDNIVAVLLNLLLACNDLGKLNHAKLYAKRAESHLDILKGIAETSCPALLQKTVFDYYAKLYDRMMHTHSKLEDWKVLVDLYKKAVEIASKIEDTSIREKWIKKLKKRYNKSRKYRDELKQRRKEAFGGKLTKTPSPKSKSKVVVEQETKMTKSKVKNVYEEEEDDEGISTPVLIFGLLGLVCTIGVGFMWMRGAAGTRRGRR